MTSDLYTAARNGPKDVVLQLLEEGSDVNIAREDGWTALHAAAYYNQREAVRLLLKYGASMDARIKDSGYQPLHKAAERGVTDIIRQLLDNGADVEAKTHMNETSLWIAARHGRGPTVQLLLQKNAKTCARLTTGSTPLHAAAESGKCEIVRDIVEAGADVNARTKSDITPLYVAAKKGYQEIVKYLMEQGADPDITTSTGWTPLHGAAYFGQQEVVELLSRDRRNLDVEVSKDGYTPLHKAAEGGHLGIVRVLIDAGAEVNYRSINKKTPLYVAAEKGHSAVVKMLLDRHADINLPSREGRTPLYKAVSKGHKAVVKVLLNGRADVNFRSKDGKTALSLAEAGGDQELIHLLSHPDTSYCEKSPAQIESFGGTMSMSIAPRNRSEDWFNKLSELSAVLRPPSGRKDDDRVKIAIIDSGIEPGYPYESYIEEYRDFVTNDHDRRVDNTKHGSTGVNLVCKVLSDHDPKIYVARVFEKSTGDELVQDRIAKAMKYAREKWNVDIITLASGFTHRHNKMDEEILQAKSAGILIFAAASNRGNFNDRTISYPAREVNLVICMFATDVNIKAITSPINPSPNPKSFYNFAIFGIDVVPRPCAKPESGTSISTFIAAAVAGLIVDFSRHEDVKVISRENLKKVEGMQAVFLKMAQGGVEGYHCVAPWRIRRHDLVSREMERHYIAGILSEATNI